MRSAGSRSGVNWIRLKRGPDRFGQGRDRQCFGQAGHSFEQHMPAGQQSDQQAFDHIPLADDDPVDLFYEGRDKGTFLPNPFRDGMNIVTG